MKNLFRSLTILALAFSLQPLAFAQQFIGPGNFSGPDPICFGGAGVTNPTVSGAGGTSFSNTCYFVAASSRLGIPRVQNIVFKNDMSDALGGQLVTYYSTNSVVLTNGALSSTNTLWLDSTGFASNDVIVLEALKTKSYQRCVITNLTATNIGIFPSTLITLTNGDWVWKETVNMKLSALQSVATNYIAQGGIGLLYGRAGQPFLLDAAFSNACTIPLINGDYIPFRDR
jgi:hypothetical protein